MHVAFTLLFSMPGLVSLKHDDAVPKLFNNSVDASDVAMIGMLHLHFLQLA